MQYLSIFAVAIAALTSTAAAAAAPVMELRQAPVCGSGNFLCGYQLDQLGVNRDRRIAIVKQSQVQNPTDADIDGLFQCNGSVNNVIWIHACNNAAGQPGTGFCDPPNNGNPTQSHCRFGPGN